jgi:diamine N-acetyltransferase
MTKSKSKIVLRAMELSDVDLLYRWENDKSIWQVSNTLVPFSRYILKKYVENSYKDIYEMKQLRLMIDVKTSPDEFRSVGSIDLFDFDPYHLRAGVGILIAAEKERRKGYATSALEELITYAFSTLQLNQLYCNISVNNKASMSLFQKVGFILVGIKKKWIKTISGYEDEALLQLINNWSS